MTTSELYHRSQVAPGVVLVTGPGGRGMTCSPAIAEDSFERPECRPLMAAEGKRDR